MCDINTFDGASEAGKAAIGDAVDVRNDNDDDDDVVNVDIFSARVSFVRPDAVCWRARSCAMRSLAVSRSGGHSPEVRQK